MLGVVVAAGLSPNTGIVQASSNCTYGNCVASQPFPLWAVTASIAAVVVALLLAFLILRRRRRPGQPPSEWEGPNGPGGPPPGAGGPEGPGSYEAMGAAGAVAGGTVAGAMPEAAPEPAWQESSTSAPAEEPPDAGAASYLETPPPPEPEPAVSPIVPPSPAPAATGSAAAGATAEEAEPDIDSLMAELEKISGEILKQKPKKRNGPPSGGSDGSSP
jgi:hypothetical protein